MTLKEISYMVLELLRKNHVVDDERLDKRLIHDWIDGKRAQYIKNQRTKNPNGRLNLNLYQSIDIEVEEVAVTDAGYYPYISQVQDDNIVVSTTEIPNILEDNSGPVILSIESEDLMKIPFSVVDYDYMRIAGHGKFNSNIIFTSIRDNRIYFKYNDFFDTYTDVVIRAIFENPRDVPGFDADTSEYPANLGLVEYIKNSIFDVDAKILYIGQADEVSDSSGEIKK